MSRAKMIEFNSGKVKTRLEDLGTTQIWLAEEIGCSKDYINKRIKAGSITEWLFDKMARALDLAPEYLQDQTEAFPDVVFSYSFHEGQKPMGQFLRETIEGLIYFSFIDRKDEMRAFSAEQKKEMLWRAVHAADAYYMEVMTGKEV